MMFSWKDNGFKDAPSPALAKGTERLYRAWGGDPQRKWGNRDLVGVCFSLDRAESRWEAEALYAVMEYRNPVLFITEFSIDMDTPVWLGTVDPGDPRALLGQHSGSQVMVERAYLGGVHAGITKPLRNDLELAWVYTGRLPEHYGKKGD